MLKRFRRQQKGFSLIEALLASSVMMTVIAGSMALQSRVFNQTTRNNDRAFASEKATQMFEELRAFVQSNQETDISKLQNYSDGSGYNFVLTTEKKVVQTATGEEALDLDNPADPLSANVKQGSTKWRFVRQIQVKPVENDPNARYVSVGVWYADQGASGVEPKGPPLANIAGILKTNITQDPPTQVYDLYMIGMENAPSWWVDLADLRPTFERVLLDLEQRNPGLTFRRHFIDKFGFGRDPYYLPHINTAANANSQALPWVYLYPGKVQHATLSENYLVSNINGRYQADDAEHYNPLNKESNVYSTGKEYREYPLADQFNHVKRFPEQIAMERRLIAQQPSVYRENSSLATFLHRLNEGALKNAIVVNLHGELLPVPPVRNFSDPAKAPSKYARRLDSPGDASIVPPTGFNVVNNAAYQSDDIYLPLAYKRVVTHPERLAYPNNENVSWRVYPYEEIRPGEDSNTSLPFDGSFTDIMRNNATIPVTSLFIPTIGHGPRYNGVSNQGFLEYPNLSLSAANLAAVRAALRVEKFIGSNNQQYSVRDSNQNFITDVVHTHDPANGDGTLNNEAVFVRNLNTTPPLTLAELQANAQASIPTAASAVIGSTQLIFNNTFTAAEIQNLTNSLIVLDGGFDSEEVVRVTTVVNSGSPSRGRINLLRALQRNHNVPPVVGGNTFQIAGTNSMAPVTRHKDFDVDIVNQDMYGHSHRGIRIRLYDTPTRHPRHTASNSGLRETRRLDGLEYIPAPINTTDFDTSRNLTDTGANNLKNTARWRVSLNTGAGVFAGAFNYTTPTGTINPDIVPVLPLETRFGTQDYYRSYTSNGFLNLPTNCNSNLLELCDGLWGDGDEYVPNDPGTSINENETQLRPNLHNVSRTYVYMNREFTDKSANDFSANRIPKLEQAQYMGDALLNPYEDVKSLHRYSRHYRNRTGTGDGKGGFDRASGNSWDATEVDMNWFYHLYSNGIMRSNAVYNSITGFSNYYYSFGGELGTDGTNAVFPINNQPWTSTNNGAISATNNNNNLINEITVTTRTISSTNGSTQWRGRNILGEMFPDDEYEFWLRNGNLPTWDYENASHHGGLYESPADTTVTPQRRYFRTYQNSGGGSWSGNGTHRRMSTRGAPTFMNGNVNPAASIDAGFEHISSGGTATLTSGAGQLVANSFNLNLSETLNANRPFVLNGNSGSGGYSTPEMQVIRNRLAYIDVNDASLSGTKTNDNVYYNHSGNSGWSSSAMVRMARPDPANSTQDVPGFVGYVLVNGVSESGTTGVMQMARFTQATSLQTYMNAGDRSIPGAAPGRSVQIPRVQVTSPRASQIQVDPTSINVQYQVDWRRWDGKKYAANYLDDWYDSVNLMYNVKYSRDNKRSWLYATDNSDVPAEYTQSYNPAQALGVPSATTGPLTTGTYSWNVAALPKGNYVFRIECYREGYTQVGYSYHDVFITIER